MAQVRYSLDENFILVISIFSVQVSFMDSRYPDAKMFKANTKIGSCSSEINKHLPNEAVMQVRHINQADRTWEYR